MSIKFENFDEFKKVLSSDSDLQQKFKSDPTDAIKMIELNHPLESDTWIYRKIVIILGIVIISIVVGVILMMSLGTISNDQQIPTILTAIGSAAIGAMSGLLVQPPKKSN